MIVKKFMGEVNWLSWEERTDDVGGGRDVDEHRHLAYRTDIFSRLVFV